MASVEHTEQMLALIKALFKKKSESSDLLPVRYFLEHALHLPHPFLREDWDSEVT